MKMTDMHVRLKAASLNFVTNAAIKSAVEKKRQEELDRAKYLEQQFLSFVDYNLSELQDKAFQAAAAGLYRCPIMTLYSRPDFDKAMPIVEEFLKGSDINLSVTMSGSTPSWTLHAGWEKVSK